jgi:CubicO group peptidase (beta-lactamase class C family)
LAGYLRCLSGERPGFAMIAARFARFSIGLFATLCGLPMFAQDASEGFDAIAKRAIAQGRVVGASVLVARGNRIIFHKGYGFADLGLEAPTKDETVYHVVGPMMPLTGVAILQQVSAGNYLWKTTSRNSFRNSLSNGIV